MRTIETIVYKFDELSAAAKQKAVDNLRDINVEPGSNWWKSTYEDAANIGLKITSFDLDRNKHAKGEFMISAIDTMNKIIKEHGEGTETYSIAIGFEAAIDNIMNDEEKQDIQELEDEFLMNLQDNYADMLQQDSDYLQTDESITETIQANDYEFTEDGKLI